MVKQFINERLTPRESIIKSWAKKKNFINTKNCAASVFCDDGGRVKKIVSVTCEKDVEHLKHIVKRNPSASGSKRKGFVSPFKRNFLDIQVNRKKKLAKVYASLSPDQKNAIIDAVL